MIKKISLLIFLGLSLSLNSSFGFDIFKNTPEKEVKNFLKNHDKAMASSNIDELRKYYSDDFISNDGFDLNETIEMYKNSTSAFKNLKYKTKVDNIVADSSWAIVQMQEKTSANVYPAKNKNKSGKLEGESSYIIYLKKENEDWKIFKDKILSEVTSLKYGSARRAKIDLISPLFIENGKEYNLSLEIDKPKNIIALGSISKEEIEYPVKNYEEKFRKISQTGNLERLVCANSKNKNEYALASVGLSKVYLNKKEKKIKIEVNGIAYIIKRMNILEEKPEKMLVENN